MPQILITIDTEIGELGKDKPDAFEIFIEGKVEGQETGYRFIIDVLDKYSVRGEFFVDPYPYKKIGEEKLRGLCQNIACRGHHVQLHTHPSMAFDKERIFMHQYSLEEQVEILEIGKQKIKDWIGKYPIAHRAGGYGIDENTFKALEKVEICYDSSYFHKNENCKFQRDVKNRAFKIGTITEIPVTVFKKIVHYRYLSCREHFQKLDIRYGATPEAIKEVVSKSSENDLIVLFLHSFNFLSLPYNFRGNKYGRICVEKGLIKKFDGLLEWISLQKNCSFTTIDQLKIDFSQDDACLVIPEKGSLRQKIYDSFTEKILRVKKI